MYELDDYLFFRGDIPFRNDPVNEIDEMVFASMGKVDYTGILNPGETGLFADCFKRFVDMHDVSMDDKMGLLESKILIRTLNHAANSPRYAKTKITHYVNIINPKETEQMCALTVLGPNGKIYVTFRGTDDTLIGWKENCELAILNKVPAQRDAAAYLESIAKRYRGRLVVSGHSKGGNLAIFAASNASSKIQTRIEKVISYDGPGFMPEFLESSGYLAIKDKISTLVPTESMVGMLMKHAGNIEVIKCAKEGPEAHDIFYWNLGKDHFERAQILSEKSMLFRRAVNTTINKMDKSERQEFVDELFSALSSTGAKNLMDFTDSSFKQALAVAGKFGKAREVRQFILMLSQLMIKGTVSNTFEDIVEKIQDKVIEPVREKIEKK